jgi:hypothetical protein
VRTAGRGVPHGLRCHEVAAVVDELLDKVHFFPLAEVAFDGKPKRCCCRHFVSWRRRGPTQFCESRASGGAVHSEAGIPVEVSDKGAWQLDENRILSDAQEVTMTKLTWRHLNRSRRWQKAPITTVFRPGDEWNWCIAKVAPAACDSCGIQVGKHWITAPGTSNRIWICETCAAHSSANIGEIMGAEPYPC